MLAKQSKLLKLGEEKRRQRKINKEKDFCHYLVRYKYVNRRLRKLNKPNIIAIAEDKFLLIFLVDMYTYLRLLQETLRRLSSYGRSPRNKINVLAAISNVFHNKQSNILI